MRIITGKYKGRRFEVPRTFKARPTTDFAKENIFNVLNGYVDIEGATALDLFAGTGSITLEMLSRGCSSVVSVEADRDHAAFIRQCLEKIGVKECSLIRGDVFRFLKSSRQQYDIIFADPPYALKELPQLPDLILRNGDPGSQSLLKPDGIFVFRTASSHQKKNMINLSCKFLIKIFCMISAFCNRQRSSAFIKTR